MQNKYLNLFGNLHVSDEGTSCMVEVRALCVKASLTIKLNWGAGGSEQSWVRKEQKDRIQTALLNFLTLKQGDRSRLVQ